MSSSRFIRMRRYNPNSISGRFDVLFPQAITSNILRSNDAGVLESDLLQYDRHLDNSVVHINRALSEGTARALSVRLKNKVLTDNFPLLLTLHIGLECEPSLSFNGGEAYPIISASGDRIPGGQIEGTAIFLVWKEALQKWVLLSSDNFTDITKVVLPVESEYVYEALSDNETLITIPGFSKKSDRLSVNYGQTILRAGLDYEFVKNSNNTIQLLGFGLDKGDKLYFIITTFITTAKRGHYKYDLVPTDYVVVAEEDNQMSFKIPYEADGAHSVVINYEQTILRNNLDYEISEDGTTLMLKEFGIPAGDRLVFTITQFVEANGELVPNNWGATGNYRYSLNVLHTEYTATEDNIAVIPVPGYNYRRDELTVIRNNHMYVYDVDYTIDEIGNVVLLKEQLNEGDQIFFTILQGAMMDVPNFNVIRANGWEGQHILLDISYSVLCDFYVLLVKLKHDLKSAPTVKLVDGPAEPIIDCFGTPLPGGYKKGSYLWLVYDEPNHVWYSLSHSQLDISQLIPEVKVASGEANFVGYKADESGNIIEAVIPHDLGVKPEHIDVTPCEHPTIRDDGTMTAIGDIWTYADETNLYVGNTGESTSKFKWTVTNESPTNDLRSYIDQEIEKLKQRPGTIDTVVSVFTSEEDGTVDIPNIKGFDDNDEIIVNYHQTVLRKNIDYMINTLINGITLTNFSLDKDDMLQFTVLKQEDE